MRIHELFTETDIVRLRNKIRLARIAALALAAVGLAVCVMLCAMTRTANASRMERDVIAISVLTGWIVIYLRRFAVNQTRRTLEHAEMLLESERERLPGGVRVSGEKRRIKNSISFQPVRSDADADRQLRVIEERAAGLVSAGERIEAVYAANGYIAAWEEKP